MHLHLIDFLVLAAYLSGPFLIGIYPEGRPSPTGFFLVLVGTDENIGEIKHLT